MKRKVLEFSKYEIIPILDEWASEDEEYWDLETDRPKPGIWDNFEHIQEEITEIDLEKGYKILSVVVRRISDNRFFQGTYLYSPYWVKYNTSLEEVFPKEVTITVYE